MNKGDMAEMLFKQGYNCSQAVVGAFCDELGLDRETAFKLASSFGGGMGRMREVCGAVSGMFIAAGIIKGYSDPTDPAAKKQHYALIQEMAKRFSDKNSSIICRELLDLDKTKNDPNPTRRTPEFYKTRPCSELVRDAAKIVQEMLFAEK